MIQPNPTGSTPLSNRGGKMEPQKTNLKLSPVSVALDRIRMHWYISSQIDPESLLSTIWSHHNSYSRNLKRGNATVTAHKAYDSPQGTPGGTYYEILPHPSQGLSQTLTIEYNPNAAPEKMGRIEHWLNAHDLDLEEAAIDRLDIAFDYAVPPDRLTIQCSPRRKAQLWIPQGQPVQTQKFAHSSTNMGWTKYDKRAELMDKGNVTPYEHLTRLELRLNPHHHLELHENHDMEVGPVRYANFRYTDIQYMELPENLGGKLIYMPIPTERFSTDNPHTMFYKVCQSMAEYDPLRARKYIIEYATSLGRTESHARELSDTLLESVNIPETWEDTRGTVWHQIQSQRDIPGTRPRLTYT